MAQDTKKLFQITEAARACGISRSTLLRMEERGLLTPAYIAPDSGRRYYDNHNVARILQVEKFRAMGLSSNEIADYYAKGGEASGQLASLERRLHDLQRSVEELRLRAQETPSFSVQIMTLPAVQENEPDYRDFIIRGQDSVVRHWLRAGASGWRLDVADELPDDFIAEIRTAMEETAPGSFLLGEVWEDATTKVAYSQRRRYLLGHELHGVMNYPFRTALIAYLRGGDADDFRETLEALRENYPPEAFLSLMNFLGTHDTPRILTVLGADNVPDNKADRAAYRLSPAQRQIGLERLRLAALILFTFPGAPTVYYGDEAAMEGWEDPFNRAGYPWAQEDTDLKAHFAELARFRHSFPALQAGVLHWIWTSGPLLIFARELDGQLLTTVVNAADVSQALSLPWSAPPARDLLTGQRFIPTDNAISLTLPPRSGLLLQTDLP